AGRVEGDDPYAVERPLERPPHLDVRADAVAQDHGRALADLADEELRAGDAEAAAARRRTGPGRPRRRRRHATASSGAASITLWPASSARCESSTTSSGGSP